MFSCLTCHRLFIFVLNGYSVSSLSQTMSYVNSFFLQVKKICLPQTFLFYLVLWIWRYSSTPAHHCMLDIFHWKPNHIFWVFCCPMSHSHLHRRHFLNMTTYRWAAPILSRATMLSSSFITIIVLKNCYENTLWLSMVNLLSRFCYMFSFLTVNDRERKELATVKDIYFWMLKICVPFLDV